MAPHNQAEADEFIKKRWGDYTKIYSDASISQKGRSGGAFVIPEKGIKEKFSLGICEAAEEAELAAIYMATKSVEQSDTKQAAIMADSRSALKTISSAKSSQESSLVRSIRGMYSLIRKRGNQLVFVWIKGHSNIPGNDAADREAKLATYLPIEMSIRTPTTALKSKLHQCVKRKWQERWASPTTSTGHFYLKHSAKATDRPAIFGETRAEQVSLSNRIRLDRLNLNSKKNVIQRAYARTVR